MKKIFLVFSAVIVFLGAIVLLFPLLFKGALLKTTKTTLNKNLQARIEFADFSLSLLKRFPKITIELKNVIITGRNEFEGDTLVSIPVLRSELQLFSLFRSGEKTIEKIQVEGAKLNLLISNEGRANWDILPAGNDDRTAMPSGESAFGLLLNSVEIENADVFYTDRSIDMGVDFRDVNLALSGKMYGSTADLKATGEAGEFSIVYDSVTYLSKIKLQTTSLLRINYEKINISVIENELLVNRLPLEVTGDIRMPGDSIWFDLTFKSKTSEFRNFLELVPPDYEQYLSGLNATGSSSLSGVFRGWYTDYEYPMLDIGMVIENGRIKYNDLPEEIKKINALITIKKPQGDLDKTVLQIKEAHAEIRNNPVDLSLLISNLRSDLFFDGAFVGRVNFDNLKNALPIDSLNMAGEIDANLFVKGTYSAIEKEKYDKIAVNGMMMLNNFIYSDSTLTQTIRIPSGKMDFSPASVNLKELNLKIGESDFNLTGAVSNYLNYLFNDSTLYGNLNLNSTYINLNQMMTLQVKPVKVKTTGSGRKPSPESEVNPSIEPFDIPERIDFTFRSDIDKALFENLPITNIIGLIQVKNGRLNLEGLRMMMLDGELKLAGSYKNTPENMPLVDFGFDILNFDIPMAFQSLTSVQRMFPVAGNTTGKLSSNFRMQGQFSPGMKLVSSSVDGLGLLLTKDIHIIDSPVFNEVRGILKKDKLKDIKIDDFTANFTVENGNLLLKPFRTKIADQETTISGNLNPQNIIDMKMDFVVDRSAFGNEIQSVLGILPGQENITRIPASVLISGSVNNPSIKLDLSQARQNIMDEVKKSTKEGWQKTINKLGEGIKKLIK